jgi:hypothetical protein
MQETTTKTHVFAPMKIGQVTINFLHIESQQKLLSIAIKFTIDYNKKSLSYLQ